MKVGHDLWMPFDAPDHQWVIDHFTKWNLRNMYVHPTVQFVNLLAYNDKFYIGDRFLQHFEDGFGDWRLEGDAVTNYGEHKDYTGRRPYCHVGPGFLASYHPTEGDRAVGRAFSPEFTVPVGRLLAFNIAGGKGDNVGVRLLADGEQVAVWRGRNTEQFEQIIYLLDSIAGKRLQLELFDHETGNWGHIMLDHVLILRQQSERNVRDEINRMIDESGPPIIRSNYDVYYNRSYGLVYVKEKCRWEAIDPYIILHVIPIDSEYALPDHRRQSGYDNLDFSFSDYGQKIGETCVMIRDLPDYPIAAIHTGQRMPGEDYVWEGNFYTWKGSFDFTERDVRDEINRMIDDSGPPIIRSNYDVYFSRRNGLVYVKEEQCRQEDVELYTILHVTPVDSDTLPDHRRQYGYDNLDFKFPDYGRKIGETCVIIRDLPDYPIAAIHTGQRIPGEDYVWEGNFDFTEQSGGG